jgi:hypothetical protein
MYFSIKKNNQHYVVTFFKDNTVDKSQDGFEDITNKNFNRDYIKESKMKAVRTALDYALNNNFNCFSTYTLDKTKIDRYDYELCRKKICKYLDNYKNRKFNDFKYLLSPELHDLKEGEEKPAVHFHALTYNDISNLDYMFTNEYNNPVYCDNGILKSFGANRHDLIQDSENLAYYITKYIVKQETKICSKYIYNSNNLNKSQNLIMCDSSFWFGDKLGLKPDFENVFTKKYKCSKQDLEILISNDILEKINL